MNKVGITTEWICSCQKVNPLRFHKCFACGHKMPERVKRKIYWEELTLQKEYFAELIREKVYQRLRKRENRMQKIQPVTWILPMTVIALFAFLLYQQYGLYPIERLIYEKEWQVNHLVSQVEIEDKFEEFLLRIETREYEEKLGNIYERWLQKAERRTEFLESCDKRFAAKLIYCSERTYLEINEILTEKIQQIKEFMDNYVN